MSEKTYTHCCQQINDYCEADELSVASRHGRVILVQHGQVMMRFPPGTDHDTMFRIMSEEVNRFGEASPSPIGLAPNSGGSDSSGF